MPSLRERARATGATWAASWFDLPGAARRVLLVDLLSTAGSGIVLPFLAIYVGRVRDLGPVGGAAAVAAIAVGSLPANLVAGAAADRYGARRALITGWVLSGAGDLVLLQSAHWPTLLGACVLIGLGAGTAYPAISTLLAEVTDPADRPAVFAARYGLANVGLSLGIAVSAVIVVSPDLHRFQWLYVVDAATFFLAGAVLVLGPLPAAQISAEPEPEPTTSTGSNGYRRVAADGAFRWLCLVQLLLVVFGYAQFHVALPIYLSRPGGLEPALISIVFLTNTVFVALAALPAGRLTRTRSRPALIASGAVFFAASWILLWLSRGSNWPSFVLAVSAVVVMGVGEVLLAPAVGPLVNELAPAELRGRYNAVDALVLSSGTITGPALIAVLYNGGTATPMFIVLTGGALAAALLTIRPLSPARVHT